MGELQSPVYAIDQHLRTLLDALPAPAVLADMQERILYCNRLCLEAVGENEHELTGKKVWQLLPSPSWLASAAMKANESGIFSAEMPSLPRDNLSRLTWQFSRMAAPNGDAVYKLGVAMDNTEKLRVQVELKETQLALQQFLRHCPVPISVKNSEGRYLYFNAAARTVCVPDLEYLGKTDFEIFDLQTAHALRDGDLAVLRQSAPVETTAVTKLGAQERYWRAFKFPLNDAYGEKCVAAMMLDVTALKQSEREAEDLARRECEARAQAEQANRSKDEFLAIVSHELRAPLAPVLTWIHMMQGGRLSASQVTHGLNVIERNVKAQVKLIDDLLDVARIAAGKMNLSMQLTDLSKVIDAALETVAPQAQAKGVLLHHTVVEGDCKVMGDAQRLRQVCCNLLVNAVKFTPVQGHVFVEARPSGTQALIVVSDTGEGIEPELLPTVFDRFKQADSTSTRKHCGLGLGLTIVRHLVELHGGAVRAESAGKEKGARFTVCLPLAAPHAPGLAAAPLGPEDMHRSSLAGLGILLVDDDPETLHALSVQFRQCQANTRTALSAEQAMTLLAGQMPDVVISDVGMPGEDGLSFIRKVRQKYGHLPPAIALSAYARESDRRRALEAGFQMHLSKPADLGTLLRAVASLCGRAEKGEDRSPVNGQSGMVPA